MVLGLPKKAARDTPGAISLHQREQGRLQVAPGSGAVGSRAAVLTEFEQRRLLRVYRSLALLAAEPHEFAATRKRSSSISMKHRAVMTGSPSPWRSPREPPEDSDH